MSLEGPASQSSSKLEEAAQEEPSQKQHCCSCRAPPAKATFCTVPFVEAHLTNADMNKHNSFILERRNTIVVNEEGGYVVIFRAAEPLTPEGSPQYWQVCCVALSQEQGSAGNDQAYLSYKVLAEDEAFRESEQKAGPLSQGLQPPAMNSLSLSVARLQPAGGPRSDDVRPPQVGYVFTGPGTSGPLRVRVFTLAETLKVGSVVDARDFTGKWYEAEVLKIAGSGFSENTAADGLTALTGRRIKVHYLGYSANYDEWLDLDADSHRIAQRGTFTIGPNLRTIRRNSQQSVPRPSSSSVPSGNSAPLAPHDVNAVALAADRPAPSQANAI